MNSARFGRVSKMTALDLLDQIPEEEWNTLPDPKHGKLVRVRQAAYHDIYEYEDGYEERFYIGD